MSDPRPFRRPCPIVRGIRYLHHSTRDRDSRLDTCWKTTAKAFGEHREEEIAALGIHRGLFGMGTSCFEKSIDAHIYGFVIGGDREKLGGKENELETSRTLKN
jgi:hypothetical protein